MKLIAFTGKMGSGKSTAIQIFKDLYLEKKVIEHKFAQPLYDMQEYIYRRLEPAYVRPDNFVKDRKLLQWLGTEFGRNLKESLWVDLWKEKVAKSTNVDAVLCDDCRFDNEAKTVKEMGGKIIMLISAETNNRIDTKDGIPNHKSEQGVDQKYVDFVVDNRYSLTMFKANLEEIFNQIMKEGK